MKRAVILAALALAPLLAACSTPCEELASKVCACEPTRRAVDACERRATQQESARAPTAAEENRCEALVDSCDCNALATAAGKRACGLAE